MAKRELAEKLVLSLMTYIEEQIAATYDKMKLSDELREGAENVRKEADEKHGSVMREKMIQMVMDGSTDGEVEQMLNDAPESVQKKLSKMMTDKKVTLF